MVSPSYTSVFLLLACSTVAFPRWWSPHHSSGTIDKRVAYPKADPHRVHRFRPGGFLSSGVLDLTTTIMPQPGQTLPTTTPAAVAPQSPAISQAPAPQAPAIQPVPQVQPAPQASEQTPVVPPVQASTFSTATTPSAAGSTPLAKPAQAPVAGSSTGSITADQIVAIAPQSQSCDGAPAAGECATAAQAAPALNSVFAKYGINTSGAQAAVIAWEVFESANFKYKINHFPGRPGQGTRCMMMPTFVSQYATQLVGAEKVQAAGSDANVLNLVNGDDEGSFGGGAWFMSAHCPELVSQFATSADAAWNTFMTSCVSTTMTDDRQAIWIKAKQALGVN